MGRRLTSCKDCDKVHRHQDGCIYCSPYCFKVTEISTPLPFCKVGKLRVGPIPKARLKEKKPTEWGNIYREQGGMG